MKKEIFHVPKNDGLGFGDLIERARVESGLYYVSHWVTSDFSPSPPSEGANVLIMTLVPCSDFLKSPLSLEWPDQAVRFVLHAHRECKDRKIYFPHPPVYVPERGLCHLFRVGERRAKSSRFFQRLHAVPVDWKLPEDTWVAGILKRE